MHVLVLENQEGQQPENCIDATRSSLNLLKFSKRSLPLATSFLPDRCLDPRLNELALLFFVPNLMLRLHDFQSRNLGLLRDQPEVVERLLARASGGGVEVVLLLPKLRFVSIAFYERAR